MVNLYEHYLSIPKFDRRDRSAINIYSKNWCVLTGLAIIAPHPHRHYTFDEFVDALSEKEDLRNFLMNKI